MANDVNINEKDLDLVDGYLLIINVNLNSLSSHISSIDLSDLELPYDLSGIVNSINNAIDGAYNGNGLSQLQENIKTTRAMLENLDINNPFSNLFDLIDVRTEGFLQNNDFVIKSDDYNVNNPFDSSLFKDLVSGIELEWYLHENFEDVSKIPNGGYVAYASNKCKVFYFSDDCTTTDVKLITYYPGNPPENSGGRNYENSKALINDLEKNGVPSGSVFAISFTTHENSDTDTLYSQIGKVASDLDIKVGSIQSISFSGSGAESLIQLNNYLKEHPVEDCTVMSIDGSYLETITPENCNVLIEKQIPVCILRSGGIESWGDGNSRGKGDRFSKKYSEMGLNTYFITENTDIGHGPVNDKYFTDGVYKYLSNLSDTFKNEDDYTVYKYENGQRCNGTYSFLDIRDIYEGQNEDDEVFIADVDDQDEEVQSDEEFNLTDDTLDSSNFKYFFEDPNSQEFKEYVDTIMRYSGILNPGTLDGADLYKLNDTIDADIEAIRNGYLPREASVRLALYYLNMAVNRPNGVATVKYANESQLYSGGLRQPVPNQLIFGSNGHGADCNGVLSWCLFRDGWLEAVEYYNNIDLIGEQISFYDAKPGDYFVTDEYNNSHQPHVGLILYNDSVNRKVYTFEASSSDNHRGVSLYVHDYNEDGTMVNEYNVGLLCVDPEKLYTEGNMSHFPFTNNYGGNNNWFFVK